MKASAGPNLALRGRPSNALWKDATRRRFDMVMAWSVDRLGRSLQDLVAFLSELHALKIDLDLHQQGVDTSTPAGKALFQMMGVFAEFERAMIRERVKSGLERAKAQGKVILRGYRDSSPGGKRQSLTICVKVRPVSSNSRRSMAWPTRATSGCDYNQGGRVRPLGLMWRRPASEGG